MHVGGFWMRVAFKAEYIWLFPKVGSPVEKFVGEAGREEESATNFFAEEACDSRAGSVLGILFVGWPDVFVAVHVQGLQVGAVRVTSRACSCGPLRPWPLLPGPRPPGLGAQVLNPSGDWLRQLQAASVDISESPSTLCVLVPLAAGVDIPSEHRPLAAVGRPRRVIPGRIPPAPRFLISLSPPSRRV